ncbi:hypothetical protein LDDCCGHA_6070 [Methylobacterium oxalidis]|nr:hypothetical protein LDDCCGHA_6070 [Methylobacterium oxalidis]
MRGGARQQDLQRRPVRPAQPAQEGGQRGQRPLQMQSSALGLGLMRGIAEDGDVVVHTKADHRSPVAHAGMRFQGPQGLTHRGAVAQQPAEKA